jgi:hypothetical protein
VIGTAWSGRSARTAILFTRRARPQLRTIVVLNWLAELDAAGSP